MLVYRAEAASVNILFIGPFGLSPKYTVSGRALPLARALARRGHQVRLLIPPWDHPTDSGRRITVDGVQVEHIVLPRLLPGIAHVLIVWRLLRQAVWSNADIIHVFKPKGYSGAVALVLWYLRRLRIIRARVVVDTDDWEGWGGWNERGGYHPLAKRVFAWQERWGLVCCDAVTAASQTLQSLAWSLGARRVCHVPNGLLEPVVLPPNRGLKTAAYETNLPPGVGLTALIYTRFVEIAPEHLAAIVSALLNRMADIGVLVLGAGPADELQRFRQCLAHAGNRGEQPDTSSFDTLGPTHRVRILGWVQAADLLQYWALADVGLFPCEDNQLTRAKSPLRLVEMMAAGLPIVAHRVGEVEHYVENRVSGLLVPAGDDEEFVNAVAELASSAELRRLLGTQARQRVKRDFSWHHLTTQVEALYQEIVDLS